MNLAKQVAVAIEKVRSTPARRAIAATLIRAVLRGFRQGDEDTPAAPAGVDPAAVQQS
ncbi:hypothetical protein ACIHCV_45215 [Streptomyces sp. NPDC051956]|uniref:hypothetical protein n=1 Tax=Streptomyces sp. NPDC051956 TaxID=3365677 RepID=UPI0037D8F314